MKQIVATVLLFGLFLLNSISIVRLQMVWDNLGCLERRLWLVWV
jgi:hypothetical protein